VTDQLLAFSRARPPQPKPSAVAELVDECRLLLTHTLPCSVELITDVDPGLRALVDPGLASQVLVNLCINAGDAMPDGGSISVAAQRVTVTDDRRLRGGKLRPGTYVELCISDTGQGMDEGTIARIFDPFFTTKPLGKGTGLGLATTKRIVSDHGGAVDVESEPGQGSCFRVYLPVASAQTPALRPEPARTASTPVVSGMVLIVDDEAPVARAAGRVLERIGLSVHIVSSGEEAVRHYEEHGNDIDLVIMDLEMPHMKGDVATERIRRIDRDARVLVSSGYVDEQRRRKLVALGACGVFPKPYDAVGLRQRVIEELLGARAA
jgi:CheY-like chemotaxis protein/anti-sigma regulatory factor (Ser/Thr protein kinase)